MKLPSPKASGHSASPTAGDKQHLATMRPQVVGEDAGAQHPPARRAPKGPPTAAAGDDDLMSQRS
jgi:hypothetical protein